MSVKREPEPESASADEPARNAAANKSTEAPAEKPSLDLRISRLDGRDPLKYEDVADK